MTTRAFPPSSRDRTVTRPQVSPPPLAYTTDRLALAHSWRPHLPPRRSIALYSKSRCLPDLFPPRAETATTTRRRRRFDRTPPVTGRPMRKCFRNFCLLFGSGLRAARHAKVAGSAQVGARISRNVVNFQLGRSPRPGCCGRARKLLAGSLGEKPVHLTSPHPRCSRKPKLRRRPLWLHFLQLTSRLPLYTVTP